MPPRRRIGVLAFVVVLLVGTPAFAFEELASLDLSAHAGQVVYLDFWASWCEPCRASFPYMDRLQAQHGKQGLVVIAVNVDTDRRLAAGFLAEAPAGFRIAFDPAGKLAEQWQVEGMPTTVLIGRNGKPRFRQSGFRQADEAKLESRIVELLDEETP